MLKIKDGINLKELEKFGYFVNPFGDYIKYLIDKEYYLDSIHIYSQTREITRTIKEIYMPEIKCKKVADSCIEDLIQADMVEKVVKDE